MLYTPIFAFAVLADAHPFTTPLRICVADADAEDDVISVSFNHPDSASSTAPPTTGIPPIKSTKTFNGKRIIALGRFSSISSSVSHTPRSVSVSHASSCANGRNADKATSTGRSSKNCVIRSGRSSTPVKVAG